MAIKRIYIDDENTKVIVTIVDDESLQPIDISGANITNCKIRFEKPDKTIVEEQPVFSGTGSDGKIEFLTTPSFWDIPGQWKIQGYVVEGLFKNHSEVDEFLVYKKLTVTP